MQRAERNHSRLLRCTVAMHSGLPERVNSDSRAIAASSPANRKQNTDDRSVVWASSQQLAESRLGLPWQSQGRQRVRTWAITPTRQRHSLWRCSMFDWVGGWATRAKQKLGQAQVKRWDPA